MEKFATKINNFCYYIETRLGAYGAAFLMALVLMSLSCLTTASRWEVHFHGTAFSQLSINPFDLSQENALRFRILSPLLGYLFFMRGPALYLYFILFIMTLFIAGIYSWYRKRQYSGVESIGMASLMAFSSVVYYIFYYPAYNDPTSYLLILLCMVYYRQAYMMILLITLLLFNHEGNLFLFPWLFYIMNSEDFKFKIRFRTVAPFIISALLYICYRYYITERSKVIYDLSYYFNMHNISWTFNAVWKKIPVGIFEAFKLFWIFPLLALFFFKNNPSQKAKQELNIYALIFFGALSQMIIAYDISRLMCLAFPMILAGAEIMREKWGKEVFQRRLWLIILVNLFVPTYLIGALEPVFLKPFIVEWLMKYIF